jgi:hypothetical protein
MLGALAVAAAVVLALLAREVKQTADQMRQADLTFEVKKPNTDIWTTSRAFPGRLARGLVGVRDDIRFRNAARVYAAAELAESQPLKDPDQLRAEATIALERFDKHDHERVRRARTANMLGALAYGDATNANANDASSLLARAGDEFRRAIALDPGAAAPKFNLELMLQLQALQGGAFAIRQGGAAGGTGAVTGAKPTGHGY